ncbi:class I SAM-dependent methyltransferase [Aestuariispira insulae]|uniref:Methyltransferase family protein n=1 Tax=Aestuariispira insulae TaxID=1461337 RepID=A0A3D9HJJ5_9PROT|nr:methyltransferase domain-containing protein [Aestuariispira insulae]RED49677.1 methyltransferase family protein [Aestuariispira insulae]
MIITAGNQGYVLKELNQQLLMAVVQYLQANPDEIFHIPHICTSVAELRIDQVGRENIRIHAADENSPVIENAVEHNLKNLIGKVSMSRPLVLSMALRSISWVSRRIKKLRVLTIGPRTEAEIFMLIACGFDPANIKGLDLISYSDFIETGDMHQMPFEDDSFDVIILGWVLAYSDDPARAASEVMRVAAPDAVIAVGCAYTPFSEEELMAQGSLVAHGGKYNSADDILRLFEDQVARVYLRDEIHPDDREESDGIKVIFQLKGPSDS